MRPASCALVASCLASLNEPPQSPPAPPLRRTLGMINVGWIFGSVWLNVLAVGGAPLTLFAAELRATPWQFGLLTAMPFLASLLSLPASLLIEHTGARKSIFLAGLYFQRGLWFVIALLPLWIVSRHGMSHAPRAMFWFLLLTFLMHAGNAVGGPAWISWMADVVPARVRGKFFSRRRQWGILPAIPAALLVGIVLDRQAAGGGMLALQWCAVIFMCAAVCGVIDVHAFHAVPDVKAPPRRQTGILTAMVQPPRDRQFLLFGSFIGVMQFSLCFMTQFASLYLIQQLRITSSQAQLMLIVGPMLAQLLVLGAWGSAVDRMGKKPVLILAGVGLVPVGLGWIFVSSACMWLGYVLLAAGAALWTGIEVANLNLVMDMAGKIKRQSDGAAATAGGTAYVATNSVIINVAGCLGGLAAGLIAQRLAHWSWHPLASMKTFTAFDVLFVISGLLRLISVVAFLPCLREPAAKSAAQTVQFMTRRLCGVAATALASFPTRLLPRPTAPYRPTGRSPAQPFRAFPPTAAHATRALDTSIREPNVS